MSKNGYLYSLQPKDLSAEEVRQSEQDDPNYNPYWESRTFMEKELSIYGDQL